MKNSSATKWLLGACSFLSPLSLEATSLPGHYQPSRNHQYWKTSETVEAPPSDEKPRSSPENLQSSTTPVKNHPADYYNIEKKNVIEKGQETLDLASFVSMLKASGLIEELTNGGPYTILAPSNEAFNDLPKGMIERLLKPENRWDLVTTLKYHILPGKIFAKELTTSKLKTLNGKEIQLESNGGIITVNDAEIIQTDIKASNGVIHIIDEVLTPPTK